MKLQQLTNDIYICDQIELLDIEQFIGLGIKTIINNRPDQEIKMPLSVAVAEKSKEFGINYYYLPIEPNGYTSNNIESITAILNESFKPVIAYCRTGNRSTSLWAKSQQSILGRETVIKKAKKIGFDIEEIL